MQCAEDHTKADQEESVREQAFIGGLLFAYIIMKRAGMTVNLSGVTGIGYIFLHGIIE